MKAELEVVPAGWLSMREASQQLARSERTIERLVREGKLRSKIEPRSGRVPERVVEAEGVRTLKKELDERATRTEAQPQRAIAAPGNNGLGELARRVALLPGVPAVPVAPILVDGKLYAVWLSLEEAAAFSGLSKSFLLGSVLTGKLAAVKGGPHGSWRIRRTSLEGFAGF
jgi:hypothetical protein